MKKSIALLLMLCITFSFCACGEEDQVSTVPTTDNITSEVGGVENTDDTTQTADSTTEPTADTEPTVPSRPIPQNFLSHSEDDWDSIYVTGSEEIRRDKITSVTFLDTLKDMPSDAWDASMDKNGSVMAWVDSENNLFFAGEGGVSVLCCKGLFKYYFYVESINFNNCFYTDLVTDMGNMFTDCDTLRHLDLSFFNTSNVTTMRGMFFSCDCLNSVDLSSFDTSKVVSMINMFAMTSLDTLDLSGFNTAKVTEMQYMFEGCDEVKSLDLSSFDTSNVTNMKYMFSDCESLESLNISSFDTSKVTDMSYMFSGCDVLTKVDLSKFDFSSAQKADKMFYCSGELTDIGCTIVLSEGCTNEDMYLHSGLE